MSKVLEFLMAYKVHIACLLAGVLIGWQLLARLSEPDQIIAPCICADDLRP